MLYGGIGLIAGSVIASWIVPMLGVEKTSVFYLLSVGVLFAGLGVCIKGFFDYKAELFKK